MIGSLLFIMTFTPMEKTCGLWRRNETMTHNFRKTKDYRLHVLVTYAPWTLKVERLPVTVKASKVQRLE